MEIKISEKTSWPECPECKERSLVLSGGFVACCECSFVGLDLMQIGSHEKKSDVKDFAMAKLAGRFDGSTGVIEMHDHKPSEEECLRAYERGSQLSLLNLAMKPISEAMAHFCKFGSFIPVALLYRSHMDEDPAVLPLDSDRSYISLKERSLKQEMVFVINVDTESHKMVMDYHCYNQPVRIVEIPFEAYGAEIIFDWESSQFKDSNKPCLIWQPIDWAVIKSVPYKFQQRYLGVIEIKNDVSITIGVYEDMDGPTVMKISFRNPWTSDPAEIKDYEVSCVEEAVPLAQEKFHKALEQARESGGIVLEFSKFWDFDLHALNILNDIRTLDLWGDYQKHRL